MKYIIGIILLAASTTVLAAYDGSTLEKRSINALSYLDDPGSSRNMENLIHTSHLLGKIKGILTISHITYGVTGKALFCAPEFSSLHQPLKVIIKFVQDHPAELHHPEDVIIALSFSTSWPCK